MEAFFMFFAAFVVNIRASGLRLTLSCLPSQDTRLATFYPMPSF